MLVFYRVKKLISPKSGVLIWTSHNLQISLVDRRVSILNGLYSSVMYLVFMTLISYCVKIVLCSLNLILLRTASFINSLNLILFFSD